LAHHLKGADSVLFAAGVHYGAPLDQPPGFDDAWQTFLLRSKACRRRGASDLAVTGMPGSGTTEELLAASGLSAAASPHRHER
jgi:hypothetical protein